MVVCLSSVNDYEGGIFNFVNLNKKFKFDKGDAIIFDSNLLHGVEPVTSGIRKVLITFMWDEDGENIRKRVLPNRDVNTYSLYNNVKLFFDKDYSDIILEKPWTDKDDYLFEDNKSDTLMLSFAGLGDANTLPTFIFYNFLKKYPNVDKLFLRDLKRKYYLTGLKNSTKNIEETVELIKSFMNKKQYKKVVAIGCSSGGYAAILYGALLNLTKVVTFAPQTVIDEAKENIIKDTHIAYSLCKSLRNYRKDLFYKKCLDLTNFIPFSTNVEIHYPLYSYSAIDRKHAEYIKHENCKLISYYSKNHRIALELRDKGILEKIIQELLS